MLSIDVSLFNWLLGRARPTAGRLCLHSQWSVTTVRERSAAPRSVAFQRLCSSPAVLGSALYTVVYELVHYVSDSNLTAVHVCLVGSAVYTVRERTASCHISAPLFFSCCAGTSCTPWCISFTACQILIFMQSTFTLLINNIMSCMHELRVRQFLWSLA
mgnify:CR=1 FL=1